ncbi:MAG: tetratricopeptide repeat protein [Bacteroides sp.]|nr:tetratricopeptide repeat protein [Bacteroides sp.]
MKRRFVFCLGAMLLAGTLAAQTPLPEWQAGVDKVGTLIKTHPEQAADAAGELLKGKNKKNVALIAAVARAYLDAGKLPEAESYLEMARKADGKAPEVFLLEGDVALARRDIGKACQLYEQAIYFDAHCKEAYLKYAQAYKSASPSQAIEKLNQLKTVAPDCLEADKGLAEVYYATNRFGEAAEAYAKFIDTPLATEDDLLKYAFALFLNHDFERSLEVARQGLQKHPRHAAFSRLVMYNNVDLKRYEEALQAADAFFNASDGADYSCLDYRYHGALLSALKQYDRAIEAYTRALAKDETQVDLWREMAAVYELMNDYPQAIAAYRNYYDSLSPDKRNLETLFQLGRLYYGEGTSPDTLAVPPADRMQALQAADSVFTLVAEQAPDNYLGDLWRARTSSALDPETTEGLAKPYYEKVVAVLLTKDDPKYRPVLIECYSYLGYYYLLKSDYATSKEYWNNILATDPDNATARKALDGIQ